MASTVRRFVGCQLQCGGRCRPLDVDRRTADALSIDQARSECRGADGIGLSFRTLEMLNLSDVTTTGIVYSDVAVR